MFDISISSVYMLGHMRADESYPTVKQGATEMAAPCVFLELDDYECCADVRCFTHAQRQYSPVITQPARDPKKM